MEMREGIAEEYGIVLYRQYGEKEAAHILGVDLTTLKRWRRAGKTPCVNMGERKVRYLGLHIADMMLFGDKWQNLQSETSKSETSGSQGGTAVPHGAGHGSTEKPARPDAFHLARTILSKPSRN